MAKISLRTWERRYRSPAFWWVTAFGSGLVRPAPGTWGSLAGLIAGFMIVNEGVGPVALAGLVALVTLVSSWAIDRIERETGIHDAPEIVIDEVAGIWLALLPLAGGQAYPPVALGVAFLLFRFFDVIKPWPIGWLDRQVHGGFGVMVDDLVAGLFAALGLWFCLVFNLIA